MQEPHAVNRPDAVKPHETILFVTGVEYEIVARTPNSRIKEIRESAGDGDLVRIDVWVPSRGGTHRVELLITEFVSLNESTGDMSFKGLIANAGNSFAPVVGELAGGDLNTNEGTFTLCHD